MRRAALVSLAGLALALLVTLTVDPWADERVSDLFVYRSFATPVLHGDLPYRDFSFEYPPLAAPVIALPGVLGTGQAGYRLAFAALALVLGAVVLLLVGLLAARTGGEPRRAMAAVGVAPLLTGAMIRTHFDLAPVALTLGALALLCTRRPRLGLAVLGVGVMTKGFPLVVAPVALAWLVGRGQTRQALDGALALALVVVVVGGAALDLSPRGASDAVRYQVDRPVQIESWPAGAVLTLDGLGLGQARSVKSYRSDGLLHPASGAVIAVFTAALVAVVALLALAAFHAQDERGLVLAALAAVAAFAAFGKVLSPQFMVWIVPLTALALSWRMHALAAAGATAIALTLVEFPSRYFDLVDRQPFPLAVVTARNTALLVALALAARGLGLVPRRPHGRSASALRG